MKININGNVIKLLKQCMDKPIEYGGMLFGMKLINLNIQALTTKVGESSSISFKSDDYKIYHIPKGNKIIGTWHHHPITNSLPSSIDLEQWEKWGKQYVHILTCKNMISVYSYKGEKIYEKRYS